MAANHPSPHEKLSTTLTKGSSGEAGRPRAAITKARAQSGGGLCELVDDGRASVAPGARGEMVGLPGGCRSPAPRRCSSPSAPPDGSVMAAAIPTLRLADGAPDHLPMGGTERHRRLPCRDGNPAERGPAQSDDVGSVMMASTTEARTTLGP